MYQRPLRFKMLPEVIKNLLIINGLFFVATWVFGSTFEIDLGRILGLYMPGAPDFRPYQLITHMFMHGNIVHILFNMFALWMFGYTLENIWGSKRFLIFYLVTGLGAAMVHLGINYIEITHLRSELSEMGYTIPELDGYVDNASANGTLRSDAPAALKQYVLKYVTSSVGASGAVFGVLLAFGMMFPNMYIYVYFAIPIKAKYFVAIYGALELYNGIQNDPDSNVAHFAHLGGMLFGYILIRYWRRNGELHY